MIRKALGVGGSQVAAVWNCYMQAFPSLIQLSGRRRVVLEQPRGKTFSHNRWMVRIPVASPIVRPRSVKRSTLEDTRHPQRETGKKTLIGAYGLEGSTAPFQNKWKRVPGESSSIGIQEDMPKNEKGHENSFVLKTKSPIDRAGYNHRIATCGDLSNWRCAFLHTTLRELSARKL